ncbi:nuclear transcription factor Y subunit B-1-like protein, partial [Tanacetum coccineum]
DIVMFKYLLKHLSAVSFCLIGWPGCRASDKCQREKRKTVNGDDLLWAMATLGFEDYIEPLKSYLSRYREMEGDTKGSGKGHEGSSRKDGVQTSHNNAQAGHQISYPQSLTYANSQAHTQHMMVPRVASFPGSGL